MIFDMFDYEFLKLCGLCKIYADRLAETIGRSVSFKERPIEFAGTWTCKNTEQSLIFAG